jgi:hypothetical protein
MKTIKLVVSVFIFSLFFASCTELENEEFEASNIENIDATNGSGSVRSNGSKSDDD